MVRSRGANAYPSRLAGELPAIPELLRKSFGGLFRMYVYLVVLLPSGSILGINIKMICFALLLPSALLRFSEKRNASLVQLGFLFAIPAVFLAWIIISSLYGYNMTLALSQYKEILVTLASCWLAAIACDQSESSKLNLLRTILHAEVAACIIKMLLLVYCFARGIPVSVMVDAISDAFGVQLMGLDFGAALGRIQFVADGLIPLCFYLLLRYRARLRIGMLSALAMFLLLMLSLIFTFSRYFWAFAVLSFVLGIVSGRKDRFHAWILVLIAVAALATLPLLVTIYDFRFSAEVAGGSDDIRTQQIPELITFFHSAPLFGHGLGSHTNAIIRSEKAPYEYEVQIYALAGQVGIVGLALMAILLALYFAPLWPQAWRSFPQKLGLILLLLVWLAAGLFNPMLLSSAAAMSYAFIRTLAGIREEPTAHEKPSLAKVASDFVAG